MALTDELRAAVASPPPPAYDLDDLIHRGRHGRTLRRLGTVAAGLVTLTLVGGTYVAASQLHPAGPGAPAARPLTPPASPPGTGSAPGAPGSGSASEAPGSGAPADHAGTVTRLNSTLRQLPAAFHAPPAGAVTFAFHDADTSYPDGYYNASWTHAGVRFTILVNHTTDPLPPADSCGAPPTASCTPVIRADVHAFLIKDPTQRFTFAVSARADHTVVDVRAYRLGSGALVDPRVLFQGSLLAGFAVRS